MPDTENSLKTRLISAHNTLAFWATCTIKPKKGEVCYAVDETTWDILEIKIGDGSNYYKDLPAFTPGGVNNVSTAAVSGAAFKIQQQKKSGTSDVTPAFGTAATANISTAIGAPTSTSKLLPTDYAVAQYVDAAIEGMPEPMIFKGSVGTGGTTASLPTTGLSEYEGWTYKVISAGTYGGVAAKVGDTLICNGTAWVLIPSGDEPSGTVTSIQIKATTPIKIDSSAAITTSGVRTISHEVSGVTAGTYGSSVAQAPNYGSTFSVPYITSDEFGHLTAAGTASVKIPAADNTNYYTTALNGATTATGYSISVAGNNAAVKGTATIPAATSATYGVVKGDGNAAHYLNGTGAWTTPVDNNYYTTSISQTTAVAGFSATVSGNNAAVKGNFSIPAATTAVAGVMTTAQASKLAGLKQATAGTGLSNSDNGDTRTINHASSITAGNVGPSAATVSLDWGQTKNITVPYIAYNNTGHTTGAANRSMGITLPANPDIHVTSATLAANTSGSLQLDIIQGGAAASTVSAILSQTLILDGNFTA